MVMIALMFRLSAKPVLIIAAVFYLIKTISLFLAAGASMACADGGNCSVPLSEFLIGLKTSPVYIIAAVLYLSLKLRKLGVARIDRALSAAFCAHLAWLAFIYLVYISLLAPLAPELLSYYSSPGAQVIRFIDTFVFPPALLAVFLLVYRGRSG